MDVANPSYLWALWGLLLPLAIHFWSRREARTLKVGSVELLVASRSKRSSNVAISEWILLLLRMAMVALAVLFMAGPQWRVQDRANRVAYLVEPALAGDPSLVTILDSLAEGAEVLLLKTGFPPWDPALGDQGQKTPPYWQLVQQMDSLAPDSLVIFARAHLRGIKGMRPGTHKKIHWVVQGGEGPVETPLFARQGEQGLSWISLLSHGQGTRYRERPVSPGHARQNGDSLGLQLGDSLTLLPLIGPDSLKVHIHTGPGPDLGLAYIEAALTALSHYLGRKIEVQRFGPEETALHGGDLNLWLREGPLEGPPGRWLVYREDPMAQKLIEQKGDSLHHLTGKLDTQNTVEGHFARQLLPLIWTDPLPLEKVAELDRRQMDLDQFRPHYTPPLGKRARIRNWDLSPWILLALALLLLAERTISKIRKQ